MFRFLGLLFLSGLVLIQTTYVNESGQFIYKSNPKKVITFEDSNFRQRSTTQSLQSQDGPKIFIIENDLENQSNFLEEHDVSKSNLDPGVNKPKFMMNKYKNGALSWSLRVVGLILCALGSFITGLGLVVAIYGVLDIL